MINDVSFLMIINCMYNEACEINIRKNIYLYIYDIKLDMDKLTWHPPWPSIIIIFFSFFPDFFSL